MVAIVIKARARILHGHDWVFSSEASSFRAERNGDEESLERCLDVARHDTAVETMVGR